MVWVGSMARDGSPRVAAVLAGGSLGDDDPCPVALEAVGRGGDKAKKPN